MEVEATANQISKSTNMIGSDQRRRDFWQSESATPEAMIQNSDLLLSADDRDEFLQFFPPLDGASVLELGAGIGRYTGELGRRARDVTVIDFMQHFLDVNQANHAHLSNLTFLCADINKLQLPQARFDGVVSGWLFVNLTRSEAVALIAKVLEWLRPGGHFIFRENSPECKGAEAGVLGNYRSPLVLQCLLETVTLSGHTLTIIRSKNSRAFIMSACDVAEIYYVAKKVPVQAMPSHPTLTHPIPANLPLPTLRDQDLKKAGVRPESQVLVLGRGSGSLVLHVANTCGAFVLGLEPSMDAFNTAIHHHHRLAPDIARLIQFEMRATVEAEFKESTFDVILVQESEFKKPDTLCLVAKMRRWTKPGGVVFLIDEKTFPVHLKHIEARECLIIGFDDVDGEDDVNRKDN